MKLTRFSLVKKILTPESKNYRFEKAPFETVQKEISSRPKKIFFSQRIVDYWNTKNRLPDDVVFTAAPLPVLKIGLD